MLRIFSSSYSNLVSECFMNTVIFDFFVKTFKELRAGEITWCLIFVEVIVVFMKESYLSNSSKF